MMLVSPVTTDDDIDRLIQGWDDCIAELAEIGTASQTEAEAAGGLNTPMKRSADASEVAGAIGIINRIQVDVYAKGRATKCDKL